MKLLSFALAAASLCLVSCSSSVDDPLASLLGSPPSAEVEEISGIIPETRLEADSVRFAGLDTAGLQYFVGKDDSSDACLLIREARTSQWGSSCGRPGDFAVEFGGVTAWLQSSSHAGLEAEENVAKIVFLTRLGS